MVNRPVFDWLMGTMWGHNLMLLHFIAIGFLYFWCVLGVDPTPRRASRGLRKYAAPTVRILELAATAPFHAFFGVMLMIVYWFAHMDWPFIENTNNLIVDYHLVYGGVLVPGLLLLGVMSWRRRQG